MVDRPFVLAATAKHYVTGASAGILARALSLGAGVGNLWLLTQILTKEQFAGYMFVMVLLSWLALVGTAGLDWTVLYRLSRIDAPHADLVGGPLVAAALIVVLLLSAMLAGAVALGASANGLEHMPGLAFWLGTFDSVIRSTWLPDAVRTQCLRSIYGRIRGGCCACRLHGGVAIGLVHGATRFVRYLTDAGVRDVALLRDRHVEDFLSTLPTYLCCNGYRMRHVAGTRGAHHLMQYLRTIGGEAAGATARLRRGGGGETRRSERIYERAPRVKTHVD